MNRVLKNRDDGCRRYLAATLPGADGRAPLDAQVMTSPQPVTIAVDAAQSVSGLLQVPREARACYVVAHGAGAGMTHPFMAAVANELAERGIATLRYQFPYMEQGSKRPDARKNLKPSLPHFTRTCCSLGSCRP